MCMVVQMDIYIFYQAEDAGPGCLYYWDTALNSVAPGSIIPLGRVTVRHSNHTFVRHAKMAHLVVCWFG
jgi:hypothetical protein